MAAADDIRINGFTHSWSSTKITIDGDQYVGITKISWDHAIEEGLVHGQGGKPLGRTRGKYAPGTVSVSMRKSSAMELRRRLASKSRDGKTAGEAVVPIIVQYLEPDDTAITVELRDVRLLKSSTSAEQNADASSEDLEFSCLAVFENGISLFSDIVL